MKVYVDKLPECCRKCPCMNDDIEYGNHCNIICVNDLKLSLDCDDCQRFRHKDCPLQTTQFLKQQVRKEVCEEIRKWCNRNFNWVGDGTGYDGQDYNEMIGSNNTINKLRELLDQIQDKGEQHG